MNILLPTDFSENAKNAAAYALKCFEQIPCTFYMLHVLPFQNEKLEEEEMQISSEFYRSYEQFVTFLNAQKSNPQHELKVVFRVNPLISAVREQVLDKHIDLIIMGTKGVSNKENVFIGKNTSEVMTKVKCPILAISENTSFKEYKEILFPTDYKIRYSGQMLEVLLNFISKSMVKVKILEVFSFDAEPTKEQEESKMRLKDYFLPQNLLFQPFYISKHRGVTSNLELNGKVGMIAFAAKNLDICHKLLDNVRYQQFPNLKQLPLLVLH